MRIAAAQLTCVPGDIAANVKQAVELARQARAEGAELVVFPELTLTGYELETVAGDPGLLVAADDARLEPLRDAGIATVINGAAPGARGPAIATYVYAGAGELICTYVKQHLFEQESAVFAAGDRDGRFSLGGLRFSLATCFDNHFPDLIGRAAADGCDVHLASSLYGTGGGVRERATIYPGIARDTKMFVVLANHVGRAGTWVGCGGSAVWRPGGDLLVEGDSHSTGVVTALVGQAG
ncbi:carbon-nitrogen hydrolase family protein [Nocardia seriolae]|nr:carbon-nitrogen hydrolase family protein [Nocardia seriolae]MTJ65374.1 carbon-nitrogen hydrolase family protein [Nocardia seriolae]MTJ71859.1 carbon-nitrogen hydrolase family protein [Nocardia seriolae]MTJ90260.1 carbon-nitrogen hydrolase family protein [Nocardia seriolae]MTK34223.1 carbon-nitrogen hydrolase family protein [Nocardia seriolae]MTK43359.1 carbon-nitrogen hydrolase family protein [Nocardia seriolae]